jgi:NTE family protein
MTISNIVFKGGGVKGIAYIGAMQALANANLLASISGFAGTSAGAITASLAACRISPTALNSFLASTNYQNFKDSGGVLDYIKDLTEYFGPYKGKYFLQDWYQVFLQTQNVDPNITFGQVLQNYGSTLKVYATDLNTQAIQEFSPSATPAVPIAQAVRASMSIPMFFEAWQFASGQPSNHLFVDGGVMYNYPIDAFDSPSQINTNTLGFFLANLSGKPAAPNQLSYGLSHIETYVKSLFNALLNAQNTLVLNNTADMARTLPIDDLGISPTDFDITPAQVTALYNSGYQATQAYLTKNITSS